MSQKKEGGRKQQKQDKQQKRQSQQKQQNAKTQVTISQQSKQKEQEKQQKQINQIKPLFTILHFNDVYDIQPNKKGYAGIVNFQAYLRKMKQENQKNLVLFSGDCFSPSILSNIYQGKQMVFCLNQLNIDYACYGNHEFDFDDKINQELSQACNFPWLLGNIKYKSTEFNLGNGIQYKILQKFGINIGIFGVGGEDWLGILSDQYEGQLQYFDVNQHSRKMCKFLRQQKKCDMIIALTHMRVPQDKKLPLQAPDIDIILGGHDHIIMKQFINGIPVLKSGDNFKNLGIIKVFKKNTQNKTQYAGKNFDFDIRIQHVPIMKENTNLKLQKFVKECMEQQSKNDRIIGYSNVDLDIRFSQVRTKQTNYANFVADLGRMYYDADCCVINSGAFRNDAIIKAGPLNYSMISNLINDALVVKLVPGSVLLQILQYGCSNLPNTYSGSFLVVSGIKFTYDYRKNPRIQQVWVAGNPLQLQKVYYVATKLYLSSGGDGFTMMKDCKYYIDQVSAIDTLSLILKFFKEHDQDFNLQQQKPKLYASSMKQLQKSLSLDTESRNKTPGLIKARTLVRIQKKTSARQGRISSLIYDYVKGPGDLSYISIDPKVDGRIISLYP